MFHGSQLDRIEAKLDQLIRRFTLMSANVDQNFLNLEASVKATTDAEASAVTLLQGLSAQLATAIAAANNGDSAALPALQAQLDASTAALAAAITANTPAATTGAPGPAPAAT